jgi:hypothetical protein
MEAKKKLAEGASAAISLTPVSRQKIAGEADKL